MKPPVNLALVLLAILCACSTDTTDISVDSEPRAKQVEPQPSEKPVVAQPPDKQPAPQPPVKPADTDSRPDWLADLIRKLESQSVANPAARIARYDYNGQVVYFLPARAADVPSRLYDAEGTIICQPDGGLTGRGDGRCPDFFSERKNEQIIWQDPRGASPESR